MADMLGTSLGLFIGSTVIVFGWAAWQSGQALAQTWRPFWHMLPYGLMLAAADRLVLALLFDSRLLAVVPLVVTFAVLLAYGGLAYRLTLARKMVGQYPWIYERDGLFGWRPRS